MSWLDKHLKSINRALLVVIIMINGYVMLSPFLPQVTYQVQSAFSEPTKVDTQEQRQQIDKSQDHLVIPKINLDQKIWVGDSDWLVNKGVWLLPNTSTPDQGSNTVMVGHRFSYKDPAVFYHLDKVAVSDPIVVAWSGKLYTYRVYETKIVQPSDVYVEEPTEESILTLYTCHPIWSTRERMVVIAKLESVE